jgi:hypothetical protein
MPADLREALFRGVRKAFDEHAAIGIHFELVSALVHPVDANPFRFLEAGLRAMHGWLDRNPDASRNGPLEC